MMASFDPMVGRPGPRRILLVFPRYSPSFGTFQHAFPIMGVKAFMPPQGLLVIAACLPGHWQRRFVDENIRPVSEAELEWCDALFVSGMHIQRREINRLCARAHAHGKPAILGGPSVSASPGEYPDFDYLHLGELGDATDTLIEQLERDPARPERQIVLTTVTRRELSDFPMPAYDLCELGRYFMGSVQFSSGCPYACEFCDIPALYGRNPRLKTSEQVIAELDLMRASGSVKAVYFVDDNFIGNRRAAAELLPALIAWQKQHGYPLTLACEATLNLAKRPELLALMREARFEAVFCGIETPEPAALKAMAKTHNMMMPLLDAVETLNRYGMEVISGIILGLDTDTPETARQVLDFVERSQIPVLTINLLQALPLTPLWARLEREGRIVADDGLESNVRFRLPYDDVVAMWRETMAAAYDPETLFARYAHQIRATYPNRLNPQRRVSARLVAQGLGILARLLLRAGISSPYRRAFWRFAWPLLKQGDIERVIAVGMVAHHLILFARDAVAGRQNASFYSRRLTPAHN